MTGHRLHVGTSGWSYADWAGRFYPPGVKDADRLAYYATRFDTVEVNATFYRLPSQAMISAWNRRLGPEFHLVLKGSRVVTHRKRLAECEDSLALFAERAGRLERLRVILWQLPPTLRQDLALLERFLAALPPVARHALEFRHESWWSPEAARLLERHRAAFVAVSHPALPPTVLPTADQLYLRFHGLGPRLYDYAYSPAELEQWAERLQPHLSGRTVYAFFNNDYNAQAPIDAEAFRDLLRGA